MPATSYFGPGTTVVIQSGKSYEDIIFDDCYMTSDGPLADESFYRCQFIGRAGAWMMERIRDGVLMSVDLRSGEITPGPASERDLSFPGHLRRN